MAAYNCYIDYARARDRMRPNQSKGVAAACGRNQIKGGERTAEALRKLVRVPAALRRPDELLLGRRIDPCAVREPKTRGTKSAGGVNRSRCPKLESRAARDQRDAV